MIALQKRSFSLLLLPLGLVFTLACHRGIIPISTRGPTGAVKPGSMYVHKRSDVPSDSPEIFLKSEKIKIERIDEGNETGSLVSPDDRRIYLFQEKLPYRVGETVLVKVQSRRIPQANSTTPGQAATPTPNPGAANPTAGPGGAGDELTKELLAALPRFDSGEPEKKVLDRIPFRITHVEPSGDAYGFYERQSRDKMDVSFIKVSVKIPYDSLLPGVGPTTDNLGEIRWLESRQGEVVEQDSSSWEDEYSLRLSGFSEARSKIALDLDRKKGQLAETSNRLKNQIVSFAAQRKSVAEERAKFMEENSKRQAELDKLTKEVADKDAELSKLKQTTEANLSSGSLPAKPTTPKPIVQKLPVSPGL